MLQKIYFIFPWYVQNAFLSIFAFFNDLRRYGKSYSKIESEVFERGRLSASDLEAFQRFRLQSFLKHAEKSKYWKEQFRKFEVDLDGNPYEQIKKLPVLTKSQVKENYQDIVIESKGERNYSVHTSGTTGSGLIFFETRAAEAERWAVWWRYRYLHGIERGTWCALFGGRSIKSPADTAPPYHRYNFVSKQMLFSCYHLSESTIHEYISRLDYRKPKWIHGYPSFISELASLAIKRGLKLSYTPKFITLGAENVSLHQQRIIKEFFGVEAIQHYGLAESTANFSQKVDGIGLTVDEDFSFVEFMGDGESKKIVGTNFSNPCFPLIRYYTGDLASKIDELSFPRTVMHVDGRAEDILVLPDGRKIGRLDHIFKDAIYVDEAQLYQKTPSALEVRIKKNHKWTQLSEEELRTSFVERLGHSIDIEFVFVDSIERTKSGKLRFVISEVGKF